MIQLLDCTLRDGAYLVNKHFGENVTHGIVRGLTNAGIDYIELGFLQDDRNDESAVFLDSKGARKYLPSDRKTSSYTAFADYSRYDPKNLDDFDGQSFEAVRACFFKEERGGANEFIHVIQEKGYKVFVQPVGILRYSYYETLEFIDDVNKLRPFCLGIVDTFGSMYADDLRDMFSLIHRNLDPSIKIGFHSHNNILLSSALSQEFVRISQNKRDSVIDATMFGMGRGTGNAPLELIVQFMNTKLGKCYNLDEILDIIDTYIQPLKATVEWGYDIPMFLAGAFSSHVNNVKYLLGKASLRSSDIRYILNRLTDDERSRYYYDRLDELYLERFETDIDDGADFAALKEIVIGKPVLVIAPGRNALQYVDTIRAYIAAKQPTVITINFIPGEYCVDFVYFNNSHRYDFWKSDTNFFTKKSIITSNVSKENENGFIISYLRLIKNGWNNFDNSTIMLLRLSDMLGASEIAIAGFDGFGNYGNDYATAELVKKERRDPNKNNKDIEQMFTRFMRSKTVDNVYFITPSRFDKTEGLVTYTESEENLYKI